MKAYLGVDNGTSGSLSKIGHDSTWCIPIPTWSCLNYQKTKERHITRINTKELCDIFFIFGKTDCMALIERPFVNPKMFNSSICAVRALEAVLICLEGNFIPYQFIDSKAWQKEFLPQGIEKKHLKRAAFDVCKRLFPNVEIAKVDHADSLLIAEYGRRHNL